MMLGDHQEEDTKVTDQAWVKSNTREYFMAIRAANTDGSPLWCSLIAVQRPYTLKCWALVSIFRLSADKVTQIH